MTTSYAGRGVIGPLFAILYLIKGDMGICEERIFESDGRIKKAIKKRPEFLDAFAVDGAGDEN